jgi:hypothetical protein
LLIQIYKAANSDTTAASGDLPGMEQQKGSTRRSTVDHQARFRIIGWHPLNRDAAALTWAADEGETS